MTIDLGSDLSCTSDLTGNMAEVSGNLCLSQALVRRITTPKGGVIDDPNYGYDVTALIDDTLTNSQVPKIAQQMDAQFMRDERVQRSATTATFSNGTLTTATTITTANGPFSLVLAASSVTVAILHAGL